MSHPPTVGIAGWSGSGKTTLLIYLIAQLSNQGVRVNVVKHSHHRLAPDAPGKDGMRLREAGAHDVLVCSSLPPWPVPDIGRQAEPPLQDLLSSLPPCDVVLLEGFKTEPVPKLEVHRSVSQMPALYPHDPNVVAVASDTTPPDDRPGRIWLDINQPAQVLAWLQIFMDLQSSGDGYGYTISGRSSPRVALKMPYRH